MKTLHINSFKKDNSPLSIYICSTYIYVYKKSHWHWLINAFVFLVKYWLLLFFPYKVKEQSPPGFLDFCLTKISVGAAAAAGSTGKTQRPKAVENWPSTTFCSAYLEERGGGAMMHGRDVPPAVTCRTACPGEELLSWELLAISAAGM